MNKMQLHRSRDHYLALDGVRGLAILLVIFFHSTFIPRLGFIDKVWHGFAFGGWVGVDLFFVLSGFLITRILIQEKGEEGYFLNFYARRFLRIFPLYYLFLFLVFFVVHQPVKFGFVYWTFLSNILVSRLGYFPSPILDAAWSLAVEEQFYLVWPLVVLVCNRKQLATTCKILFVFALGLRLVNFFSSPNPLTNYVLLPTRMDSLAAGAWLAVSKESLPQGLSKKLLGVLVPTTAVLFCMDASHSAPWMQTLGFSLNALLALFLIGALLKNEVPILTQVFENRFLRICGKYSYGMYLFHVPVIHWVLEGTKNFWNSTGEKIGMGFPIQILFHLVSILATLLVAFVVYHVFEKHFLKLKRYFESAPLAGNLYSF